MLYQFSLNTGQVPADWKNAFSVLVFKKGEKTHTIQLSPCGTESVVYNLLEHIVHSWVMRHFDRNPILTDHQHGFRAKRSCETQLLTTIQKITRYMIKKGQVDVILLDFANAFDKVSHQRLVHKLHFKGVKQSTLRWIESFLSKRKQSVLLDGTRSL